MPNEPTVSIVYQDTDYVAVNKPAGILVHRSRLAESRDALLQRLRDRLGVRVYPVHRLDRATSGLLVFGLHPHAARRLAAQFKARTVTKRYLAICRGWTTEAGCIDYPLEDPHSGRRRPAQTHFRRLATVELPIPISRYPAARYSLLEVYPQTGRMHQIRRHFAHLRHPLIGDTTYGEGRHNRLFREHFGCHRLLLHAEGLRFVQPLSGAPLDLHAPLPVEWRTLLTALGWAQHCPTGADPT